MTVTVAAPAATYIPQKGDIYRCSWGYDQTNVDYYQVVEVTPSKKSVYVLPIGLEYVERRGPGGDLVVPVRDRFLEEWVKEPTEDDPWNRVKRIPDPMLKRLKYWRGEPSFRVASYADAYLWDGRADYQTDTLYGH